MCYHIQGKDKQGRIRNFIVRDAYADKYAIDLVKEFLDIQAEDIEDLRSIPHYRNVYEIES